MMNDVYNLQLHNQLIIDFFSVPREITINLSFPLAFDIIDIPHQTYKTSLGTGET